MKRLRATTLLATLSTLALAGLVPVAAATHADPGHTNWCNNGTSDDVEIVALLNDALVLAVDTGLDGDTRRTVCVNDSGVQVGNFAPPAAGVTGQVVTVHLCNGFSCAPVLATTGAGVGPGAGIPCTLGQCVYLWVNGVRVLP